MRTSNTSALNVARRGRESAIRALRGKVGRARFIRTGARFDSLASEVHIGVWLLDKASVQYPPGAWPLRRATVHWRRHEIVIAKALNYEFQIDEEVPYAILSHVELHPTQVVFRFGRFMRITVGVSELSIACRPTDDVRTDWGVSSWAFTLLPMNTPFVSLRGVDTR